MRLIINPWLHLQGYNCFGCCATNPHGMRMQFYDAAPEDPNAFIYSVWQPTFDHQSWLNTLHGGLQATLLDEVCGWVVFAKLRTSGVTAKMDIRYRKAVSTINGPIILRASLTEQRRQISIVTGEIWVNLSPDPSPKGRGETSPIPQPLTKVEVETAVDEQFLQNNYQLAASCECTYFSFNKQKAEEMGYKEPALSEEETSLQQAVELAQTAENIRLRPLRL